MLVKDIGICVGRKEYSETSQIVTIFSRGQGKIRGIAKGARRAKGKFSGGIELLSRGQVVFSPGRGEGLVTLAEWTTQENYLGIRRDLQQLYRAYYLAELLDLFTEEHDRHEQLYDFFGQVLSELCSGCGWEEFLVFQVRLLREVGLSPQLSNCGRCGKDSGGRPAGHMSFSEGGILCRECARVVSEKEGISPAGLKIVRKVSSDLAGSPANEPTLKQGDGSGAVVGDEKGPEAQELLGYWIRAALNREPKTAYLLC